MNLVMFAVGTVISITYIIGLVWNIGYRVKGSKEEKYGYYSRHNQPEQKELK